MANKLRGEVELTIGKEKMLLRPTFAGLVEAETRAGKGLNEMLHDFGSAKFGITTVAALVYGGLVGADDQRFSFDKVGTMIMKYGVNKLTKPVGDFLLLAMNISKREDEVEGKPEPAAKTKMPANSSGRAEA